VNLKLPLKTLKGCPVVDCEDALDIKIFPDENYCTHEQVKSIVNRGNGRYTFSATKQKSCSRVINYSTHRLRARSCQCSGRYGTVIVQIFEENVQGSPHR